MARLADEAGFLDEAGFSDQADYIGIFQHQRMFSHVFSSLILLDPLDPVSPYYLGPSRPGDLSGSLYGDVGDLVDLS